ncbi:MAG TPA: alpha/beta fold hydrolase [Pirellulaceae bacterium]|nr:alpha/beta fold hydrolase [Pirellulaceae bacterium]
MSLAFPNFRPHPLIRGGHLQTVVGSYLPWLKVHYRARQHHVPLPDGDQIVLHDDLPASPVSCSLSPVSRSDATWQPGDPVALLLHGLGGCHQSGYMQRCAVKLAERGYRVFRMDLRGYGAGFPLARHPVHAGRSEDAAAALSYVIETCPDSPIHLVGFSMGANIVLKLAGELGSQAPPHLASVMAIGPPIDLIECSKNMQRGWNRLYDRRFARNLVRFIQQRSQVRPDALSRPLVPQPRSLLDFDAIFTAPLSGFADTDDYYTQASSGRLLPRITVPTLIVTAASDPIIPVGPFERASYSPSTQLIITPCGGHLGFVGARGVDPDHRWLDWRIVEWVASHAVRPAADPRSRPTAHSRDATPAL